ncbi:MAG: PilZ domain-containing protein, partial [Methylomicrobium sp.]|nr:PilZ domain-containing protein [Methylomicrobium sp.]
MLNEQRKHPRIPVKELKAHVSIDRVRQAPIEIDGDVIDISYTGIKIRLNSPLPEESEGIVKIVIVLPESKIPITIHGE